MSFIDKAVAEGKAIWPFARYRFSFRVTSEMHFTEFSGSAIRGAFGWALRRAACMTRQKDCSACPLFATCPYSLIFETPAPENHSLQKFSQVPHAYVIEPPEWGATSFAVGDIIEFNMVLIGSARNHLALVIYAMQRAFSFKVGNGSGELISVRRLDVPGEPVVYTPDTKRIAEHDTSTTISVTSGSSVTLQFNTILRLQNNGRPLRPDELAAATLLKSVMRRVSLVCEMHAGLDLGLDFQNLAIQADNVSFAKADLSMRYWRRYSSRQKQSMGLYGMHGTVVLENVPQVFGILLAAGSIIHTGKGAVFGLGQYDLS